MKQKTRLRMKLKNKGKKHLKGKKIETNSKTTEYSGKKAAEKKFPKPEKRHMKLVVKQKVLQKRLTVIPRHQKWQKSSSRLKSVPEKLKNYFTEQDEEQFSSQETDNVFV